MTKFEKFKNNLTIDSLAQLGVKLIVVNNETPYYITTSGQLYPMTHNGLANAIIHEKKFWSEDEEQV